MIGCFTVLNQVARRHGEEAAMTLKRKGRAGWHQATPITTSNGNSNRNPSRVKALVVTLAVWGLFPMRWAERIEKWESDNDQ